MDTNEAKLANKGAIVAFTYKNREVKGEVVDKSRKILTLSLHTDYIGKNVEWDKGEDKEFMFSQIKDFRVTN